MQEAVPEEVVRVFFTVLTDPASVQAAYNELPSTWAGRAPHFHAFEFLGWLTSSRHHDLIMEQLMALLPTVDEIVVGEVADQPLHCTFPLGAVRSLIAGGA